MPQVFKIAGYTVYFWVNENDPLEPVHVHIAKGIPSPRYKSMDHKKWQMPFMQ